MDISTIAAEVASNLSANQASVNALIAAAKTYLSDAQSVSEGRFIPDISVNEKIEFRPAEQDSIDKPIVASDTPKGPDLPPEPPNLVLHDYVAADPLDISSASSFGDIPAPSGDSLKISSGESATAQSATIADQFVAMVTAAIQTSEFDNGYVQGVRAGIASRFALSDTIANRVEARLALMGLPSTKNEILTLAGYQATDDTHAISNKQKEAKVENDRNMAETATRLAETLYQHANEVYQRALDVAKTTVEVGNALYQMMIGIERSSVGIAKVAMEADFETVNAKETINKLNFHARSENVKIFNEVSDMAIRSLENITGQFEAKVSRYGISIDKARMLAEFEMGKGRLSEQALVERVNIAIQNASNALDAFVTIANEKRYALSAGEYVYSEAIRGAIESDNTLIKIGSKSLTTTQG